MAKRAKLKKGDISLLDVYSISKKIVYKEKDNKEKRMKLDVVPPAKLIRMKHYKYDTQTKQWEQVEGLRHTRLEFIISTKPISYKKTDTIPIHRYPVTFLFYDITQGWNSSFRWRTGSWRKPKFARKGASKDERLKITNQNIKNGIQMQFFFDLMWALNWWGLLYGPVTCLQKVPNIRNKELYPFFDKHALFVVEKILVHLLRGKGLDKIRGKVLEK